MTLTEKMAIAAALRAYFVGIGHIDETTDKQCKTWYADYTTWVESDDALCNHAFVVTAELTVHTNCCCKVESDEFSDEECGENGCQEHMEFSILIGADDADVKELCNWLTWGGGPNHWILSKDKAE